jgi:hypothetical protein
MGIFGAPERLRPGRRVALSLAVSGRGGPVQVQATLSPSLVDVQVPKGATWDPLTRTLRYTLTRVRGDATRRLRARVSPTAALQTPVEIVGYATGPDDPLPLDDRGVFRAVVARRSSAAGARAAAANPVRGFCLLPYDYT